MSATTSMSLQPLVAPRAWYSSSICSFLKASPDSILGELTRNSDFAILPDQRDAWFEQIALLKEQLNEQEGSLFFEFSIPRMGRRIDSVLLIGAAIFALEFKI